MATLTRNPRRVNYPDASPMACLPRKPRTVKPAHGTARLTLAINQTAYTVRPLPIDPAAGLNRLFRLAKPDGEVYDLVEHRDGSCQCSCPSFIFDHEDHEEHRDCKHLAAARAVGLLPPAREGVGR